MQIHMVPLYWGYTIRDNGEVRSPRGTLLKAKENGCGYLQVCLRTPETGRKRWKYLHRLLARAFVKNPRPDIFHIVDHINGDTLCNDTSNLRWLNRELNMINLHKAKNAYYNKKFKKWKAMVRGQKLGWFKTYEEAHLTSKAYRLKLFEEIYAKRTCSA